MVLLKYSYNHIYYDSTHCIFIKIIQSLSQRRRDARLILFLRNIEKSTSKYIYIRLELCLSTFVYPCGSVVRVVDLRPRVWGVIESVSWPCIVQDGSHIVIWTACKITLDHKNVVVDFDTIHGNAYMLAETLEALI